MISDLVLYRSMLPPGPGTSGTPREEEVLEELYPVIVEHSAQLQGDRRRMQERVSIHRRNISTLASPVILVFDGFHNIVYHLYLATRWVQGCIVGYRLFFYPYLQ